MPQYVELLTLSLKNQVSQICNWLLIWIQPDQDPDLTMNIWIQPDQDPDLTKKIWIQPHQYPDLTK
jgi:hypothetical protein